MGLNDSGCGGGGSGGGGVEPRSVLLEQARGPRRPQNRSMSQERSGDPEHLGVGGVEPGPCSLPWCVCVCVGWPGRGCAVSGVHMCVGALAEGVRYVGPSGRGCVVFGAVWQRVCSVWCSHVCGVAWQRLRGVLESMFCCKCCD